MKDAKVEQQIRYTDFVGALFKPAEVLAAEMTPNKADLIHATIGICGEAGELLDAVKKAVVYNKDLDMTNVIEELGDIEFYLEALRRRLSILAGTTIDRDMCVEANVAKLKQRYESLKYSDQGAQERKDKAPDADRKFFGQNRGHQEHPQVLKAAGIPSEGDGQEHGVIMDEITRS